MVSQTETACGLSSVGAPQQPIADGTSAIPAAYSLGDVCAAAANLNGTNHNGSAVLGLSMLHLSLIGAALVALSYLY